MLKKGDKAPYFELPNQNNETISLDHFKNKWLILYFYPKDNTPGCTGQAIEFAECYPELQQLGVELVGINADSVESHMGFCTKHKIPFSLLSDSSKDVLNAYKVWGEKKFMDKVYESLSRSTFIINPEGMLEEVMYNVKVKNHSMRVMRTIKQILGAE